VGWRLRLGHNDQCVLVEVSVLDPWATSAAPGARAAPNPPAGTAPAAPSPSNVVSASFIVGALEAFLETHEEGLALSRQQAQRSVKMRSSKKRLLQVRPRQPEGGGAEHTGAAAAAPGVGGDVSDEVDDDEDCEEQDARGLRRWLFCVRLAGAAPLPPAMVDVRLVVFDVCGAALTVTASAAGSVGATPQPLDQHQAGKAAAERLVVTAKKWVASLPYTQDGQMLSKSCEPPVLFSGCAVTTGVGASMGGRTALRLWWEQMAGPTLSATFAPASVAENTGTGSRFSNIRSHVMLVGGRLNVGRSATSNLVAEAWDRIRMSVAPFLMMQQLQPLPRQEAPLINTASPPLSLPSAAQLSTSGRALALPIHAAAGAADGAAVGDVCGEVTLVRTGAPAAVPAPSGQQGAAPALGKDAASAARAPATVSAAAAGTPGEAEGASTARASQGAGGTTAGDAALAKLYRSLKKAQLIMALAQSPSQRGMTTSAAIDNVSQVATLLLESVASNSKELAKANRVEDAGFA
jgi:hypothetical protein